MTDQCTGWVFEHDEDHNPITPHRCAIDSGLYDHSWHICRCGYQWEDDADNLADTDIDDEERP